MNTNLDSVGVEIGSSSLLIHVIGSVEPTMILHLFQCWSFPKVQITVFFTLLVRSSCNLCYINLYITVYCISPVDNGEQNSKYWDYFRHDRCCHTIDFNSPLLGQDFIFVVTYSPLKSMVVDNIMLLIVQLNDGKKDNLR